MENTQVGPFRILEKLGTTRRHKVYRGLQIHQNREFAIKFLTIPPHYDRKQALAKLTHEFQILKSLRHPNLVRSYGAGIEGDRIFWATELIDGESLSSILSRRGRIAPDQVTDYARQVALCLEYLHAQHFIHSKLTPDKLLVAKDGTVHVADLRLNRSKKRRWDSVKLRDAELAAYLAPEQLTGFATHKSDIYSLGTIMYEMLTGHLPFPPDNIARMTRRKLEDTVEPVATQVLNCPIWLDRLVMRMIDPSPRKRPHSAQAVRLALEEITRIDATSRSAIDELSGAFNPLHVNVDKDEARRLLKRSTGIKTKKPRNWMEVAVLAATLTVAITAMVFLLWPEPTPRLLTRAEKLILSDDSGDWSAARQILSQLKQRRLLDSEQQTVDALYLNSRRKTLLDQAARGVQNGLQSQPVQRFVGAFQLEREKKFGEAYREYEEVLSLAERQGEEPFVIEETRARLRDLELLRELPSGIPELLAWISPVPESDTVDPESLLRLAQQLSALIARVETDPDYRQVVEMAEARLTSLERLPPADER